MLRAANKASYLASDNDNSKQTFASYRILAVQALALHSTVAQLASL